MYSKFGTPPGRFVVVLLSLDDDSSSFGRIGDCVDLGGEESDDSGGTRTTVKALSKESSPIFGPVPLGDRVIRSRNNNFDTYKCLALGMP